MKKLLITYASYGSGHKSVAEYVEDYFKEHSNDFEIKVIDVMDYASLIAKMDQKIFNLNFKFNNSFSNTIGYEISDNKIITAPYKELTKAFLKSKLKDEILKFNPDIMISTHFLGSILMGSINKKYDTNTKIITILTDYASHSMWLKNHKREDAFIVSNELVKEELMEFGIPEHKIYPYGIPLSSKFKKIADPIKTKEKYKVNNNKLTCLFFGGGSLGSSFSYSYFKQLLKENLDINIIFVAGKNEKLQEKCQILVEENNLSNINILGFTKDVSNLLNIADFVVTKPGGLSVTESLEMKTPMILIPGNGGQENHNAKFITKNKFGIRTRNPYSFARKIRKIINNPKLIKEMYNNLKNYQENKSVEKLFKLVLKMEKMK
ncbi:MAG: glycosyltransferase [Bacilli bacterium]|nr:glycosyltransferase [Bacilli bacterium]